MDDTEPRRRRLLLTTVVAITFACIQYTLLTFYPREEKAKAKWSEEELRTLIDFLYENHLQADDGGNFNKKMYDAAANAIEHLWESGPKKTGEMCRSKWLSTKTIYLSIQKFRRKSGMSWDNVNGASIGDAEESVWEEYLKADPKMKPFRNRGWEHYDKVEAIVPKGKARGKHAFSGLDTAPPRFEARVGSVEVTGGSCGGDVGSGSMDVDEAKSTAGSTTSDFKQKFLALGIDDGSSGIVSAESAASQSHLTEATKTQNILINTLNGALNRIHDSLVRHIPRDIAASDRATAVELVEKRNDGLNYEEEIRFVGLLSRSSGAVETYLGLHTPDFRNACVRKILQEAEERVQLFASFCMPLAMKYR